MAAPKFVISFTVSASGFHHSPLVILAYRLSILAAWENMPRYSQGQMESSSADTNCTFKALLSAPNPDDPLSENIAKHWKSNEAEAVET
ncbi:hypothetical protein Gohar_014121, partial [Gossypium harknessii]|nr:hypothetical protein [Gossypium harknessii]